jgi:hypothetical protein
MFACELMKLLSTKRVWHGSQNGRRQGGRRWGSQALKHGHRHWLRCVELVLLEVTAVVMQVCRYLRPIFHARHQIYRIEQSVLHLRRLVLRWCYSIVLVLRNIRVEPQPACHLAGSKEAVVSEDVDVLKAGLGLGRQSVEDQSRCCNTFKPV